MDLTTTTEPDSTQINADDLIGRDVTVTITGVRQGNSEQPVNIDVAEFPDRAYRPSKSMRRVLVAAWGADSSNYVGRRMTLYRDPEVSFGKDKVGGIKISALSHIDRTLSLALTVSRGKRAPHKVEPLPDAPAAPAEPTAEEVAACVDQAALKLLWDRATSDERKEQIRQRKADLDNEPDRGES